MGSDAGAGCRNPRSAGGNHSRDRRSIGRNHSRDRGSIGESKGEAEEEPEEAVEEVHEDEQPQTPEPPVVERDKAKVRALTREERELYAPFIQSKSAREQLVKAIDNISLAAYTGNVIITGEEGMDTLFLAKI